MESKDLVEIMFQTRERDLILKSNHHIGYDEARNFMAEFLLNNLDFSDYPEEIVLKINFKYKKV